MKRSYLTMAALCLATMSLVFLTAQSLNAFRNGMTIGDQLNLLVDVRNELMTGFVEPIEGDELVEAALRGMVESLNDPYTVYMNPSEMPDFERSIRGSFSGIGAEIEIREGRLRIASPLEDSPAWQAGILAGDTILEIDGVSTAEFFADLRSDGARVREAVNRLTGETGTQVQLRIRHETGEERDITITRARIQIPVIKGVRRLDENGAWDFMLDPQNKIGYIRLTQFTQRSAQDLRAALEQLKEQDVQGLILDLRFDPGGLLEAAVEIADMFLPAGQRIVSVRGRAVSEHVEMSTSRSVLTDVPMVVLANEGSASASEIVTGALLDNGRAQFIGTRTFGKGSVQTVKMLQNERGQPLGMLKMTNAYYYLPSGRNIHRRDEADVWGVDPAEGFYVPMDIEQVQRMVEVRRERDVLRPNGPEGEHNGSRPTVTPEWIDENLHDPQLAAGLEALLGKIETGDWPRVGESRVAELVDERERERLLRQREMVQERLHEIDAELNRLGVETGSGE